MNGFFYIILYYGLSIFVEYIKCDQVVLLDTTKEATLEWTRYPYGPQAQTPGWVEESFTNFGKGINWRSYVVCDVAYNNVNNWLWSPFIDRGPANRLYIEIQFTIRDCSLFPGNALSCKETFSLLFYEFDAATREPPPWQPESYKLIARIAAGEGRFNQNSDVDINTEVKSIAVTKKGVYFAFRDQGACISVLAVKVFYVTCPAVTINFAKFNETPTGREITIIEQQFGICVENAEIIEMPKYLCKGDGKWTLPSGGCRCKLGFEGDTNLQHCKKCPRDFFRSDDVHNCTRCPENSRASEEGSLFCKCDDAYFRYPKQKKNTPCRKPPPSPISVSLLFVDASSAVIEWKGLENNLYHIECITCSSNVIFHPQYKYFNQTKITLTNLESLTTYFMKIYALNEFLTNQEDDNGDVLITLPNNDELDDGSSEILKIFNFIDFNFTTKEATIFYERNDNNLRISTAKPNAILISWTKSNDNDLEMYQIKYFESIEKKSHGSQATTIKTIDKIVDKSLNQVLIDNLESNRKYGFQIRTKTSRKGWSEYSPIVYAQTISSSSSTLSNNVINNNNYDSEKGDIYSSEDDSSEMRFFASISVAVVVFLVLTIIALVFFLRTKHQDDFIVEKKAATMEKNPLDYASNDVSDFFGTTNSRSYVDPHTYEDPNQAVREFAREIDASCITIEAIIGGGEFGDVCRGRLKIPYGPEIDVAIKTLKPNSTEKSRFDFLTEASIMGQFQHPNIIYLQGVVTKTTPVMIVTEFMENGSLDTFLRANDGKFSMLQLIEMLRGIASGMAYLSEMNYVHRDLAARNVLVNSALTCKIADFGLSREIETASDAYTTRGGKIPIRWTAPEAIAFRKFSSASDTWSFGIVMWEVTSFGERPYWNWSNHDVIKSIEKGYRLPAPENCPEGLYQLMLDCWQRQKIHRPNFRTIEKILDNFIKNPATIFNTIQKTSLDNSNRINQVYVDEYFVSVDFWLEKIKMERYKGVFLERGIVTKEQISRLTATQLSDMGITLVGHQKKILHQARQLS